MVTPAQLSRAAAEIWGGLECSITRVNDRYYDQFARAGHYDRPDDLRRIRDLGIRVLRYPLLWERNDWRWADERMELLRALEFEPIIGLVHHGSGPPHTSLLDDSFVTGLASHAGEVAARYPWVSRFTPVNEPLTTARFSALYGHWYPHRSDASSFIRALLIECRAVREAMRAIRRVVPNALLVQTEDIGCTYSTPPLTYQAEFDNHRRWLSLDLLCGTFRPGHPLWDFVRHFAASESDLATFIEDPCPPDIIGVNYYITSERFLDHRLDLYPRSAHGGNGRDAYADEAAVRVCKSGLRRAYGVLRETWERYRIPIAVTEAHLGCTREEQLRWLTEVWSASKRLAAEGVDIRAVTAWSLFGAYDWNSLLTRDRGFYEPGAFDLRSPAPRPTALADCIASLAEHRTFQHPVLASVGWWRRDDRFICAPAEAANPSPAYLDNVRLPSEKPQPILIVGATGTLGRAFARLCQVRGLEHRLLRRAELDIANEQSIEDAMTSLNPWAVINAAGFVRVDDAETERYACLRENVVGPAYLAATCAHRNLPLVTFSTDLVFDGATDKPYIESDRPNPLNVYGRSKLEAERVVLKRHPKALVVRTSAFFGPWDQFNFAHHLQHELRHKRTFTAASDAVVSPTYVPDLVNTCLDLLIDGARGVWHLANEGALSWFEFAKKIAAAAGLQDSLIVGKPVAEFGWPAPRPVYSALRSERATLMPTVDDALCRYMSESCAAESNERLRA